MDKKIGGIVNLLMEDYAKGRVIDENKMFAYPDKDVVIDILEKLKVVTATAITAPTQCATISPSCSRTSSSI